MNLPKEYIPLIEAEVRRWLPAMLQEDDVIRIAERLYNQIKDKTSYAPAKHTHSVSDVQGIDQVTAGLAKSDHTHAISDVEGLQQAIDTAVASVPVPTDYASKSHVHQMEDVKGLLPMTRIQDGGKLLIALQKIEQLESHSHPELTAAIQEVKEMVTNLPKPTDYDDSALKVDLDNLRQKVEAIAVPKTVPVELTISPVPAPSITSKCEYLILGSDPVEVRVTDAKGQQGTASVTARGDKYLVRPTFPTEPSQPLTFVFGPSVPPPTLCSIGSSMESVTN